MELVGLPLWGRSSPVSSVITAHAAPPSLSWAADSPDGRPFDLFPSRCYRGSGLCCLESFEVNGLLLPNFEFMTWTIGEPSVESGDLEVAANWSSTCSRLVGLNSISWIIISLLTK